jgi:hypothetical protein
VFSGRTAANAVVSGFLLGSVRTPSDMHPHPLGIPFARETAW